MAECAKCLGFYSDKRKTIGYDTCLECGGTAAAKEAIRRTSCSAPGYNKGNYVYIHNRTAAKDAGR